MNRFRKILPAVLAILLFCPALPAAAAATVWAINDAAQPVPHSYMGTDWIGYISFGQSFELIQAKGDYAQLRNAKGNTGWVSWEHLVHYDPNKLNQTMYVAADGDILWPQAQHEENPIPMKRGDAVTVVGLSPNEIWYRVQYKGEYYYAPYKLLAGTPAPAEGFTFLVEQRYVFGSGVELYATPYETTEPFAYIDDGAAVTLMEVNGSMARIKVNDSLIGYTQLVNLVDLHLY